MFDEKTNIANFVVTCRKNVSFFILTSGHIDAGLRQIEI